MCCGVNLRFGEIKGEILTHEIVPTTIAIRKGFPLGLYAQGKFIAFSVVKHERKFRGLLMRSCKMLKLFQSDANGLAFGVAVDAAGDERKSHTLEALLSGQRQTAAIGLTQQRFLPLMTSVPDGPDRVNN